MKTIEKIATLCGAIVVLCTYTVKAQHLDKNNTLREPIYIIEPINSSIPPTEDCYCYYYNDFYDYHSFVNSYLLSESTSIQNQWYNEQKGILKEEVINRLHLDPNYSHNYSYGELQSMFFNESFSKPITHRFLNVAKGSSTSQRNSSLESYNKTYVTTKIFQLAQNNNSYDFGDLTHNNKRIEDMSYNEAYQLWNQYGTENVNHELDWQYHSIRIAKINNMLNHQPLISPSSEYEDFTNYISGKFKNHVNSQSLSNHVSLMTGYMIYEWQLQYLYSVPNQLLTGTGYDFYYPYNDSNQINAAMNSYINNVSVDVDPYAYPDLNLLPEEVLREYSMTKQNLGNLSGGFYEGKDAIIEEGGIYQEFHNYNYTSKNTLKNLAEYFLDDERFVTDSYWDGAQAYGQSITEPESLMSIRFSNTAYNNGFANFGHVLEALENYPNLGEQKGALIRKFLEKNNQSMTGFTNEELGLIFDFEHLSINMLGLKFSDYALNLIINIRPGDNQYGWDIFRDPLKIRMLHALADGDFVDFEDLELMEEFFEIKESIPEARLDRLKELKGLIEENPFALLEDCIQQNGLDITNYELLYNHTLPQVCIDKLDSLGDGFEDQPLNSGNSAVANVDYYGVEITQNPDFNLDGIPDTNSEVFEVYRENFTSWASGSEENFQFSCDIPFDSDDRADISWTFSPYYPIDQTIWSSSNPITALIRIDAWGDVVFSDLVSDDGAIMISAFESQYWIGSTVATFITGTQPFSGNRQWGYLINQNDNLELYARAVDVARVSTISLIGPGTDECKEDTYYNIGEATWSNLQEQIKTWINLNGGRAEIVPKTAIRFDKTKLKEMLKSNQSIDQINCD